MPINPLDSTFYETHINYPTYILSSLEIGLLSRLTAGSFCPRGYSSPCRWSRGFMYISKHFTHDEVKCKDDCGFDSVKQKTLDIADAIRIHEGKPVKCSSACRCVDHNDSVGGAKRSRHLPRVAGKVGSNALFSCDAMDLLLDDPLTVANWLDDNHPKVSYIVYRWGLHVDCRPNTYKKR